MLAEFFQFEQYPAKHGNIQKHKVINTAYVRICIYEYQEGSQY